MKKLLSILGAVGLTATASTAVVACSSDKAGVKVDTTDTASTNSANFKISAEDAKKLEIVKQDSNNKWVLNTDSGKEIKFSTSKDHRVAITDASANAETGEVTAVMQSAVKISSDTQVKFSYGKKILGVTLKQDLQANAPVINGADATVDGGQKPYVKSSYSWAKGNRPQTLTIPVDNASTIGELTFSEEGQDPSFKNNNISFALSEDKKSVVVTATSKDTKFASAKAFTLKGANGTWTTEVWFQAL
ncbi:lipoprotein [Mesoplasma lactucae]|uniref:Uncharacterized protein n=1 Tax=Mesoplasma lactucae ATCC 49193 TaxID=81460 RepID=A0A291IRE2_9MOLU|nr:lipoprotein [Mesoplasma lactucae]ATG97304.1 hypothetical protein CP520_00830 [Mesoplasma lactucae ATCC 49193]ATZ20246.1 hypothetical protein MLACT_v1c04250 [Mesoplasma lactucae ATCC 49193]MCL8216995.1 hypothetical protein [Mesoplasma lactucae ATCC 49193]